MNLHVIEISPHIYAGSVNRRAFFEGEIINTPTGYSQQEIPTGGIAFLFNKIFEFAKRDLIVFVADREATRRKDILETYKQGRPPSPEIDNQRIIAERILEHCGFQVCYEEGYEADDLVYAICHDYKDKVDHIYVHTDDSDLYINVDENVTILPCRNNGKIITRDNYEYTVKKDVIVPYNSLTFLKFLEGDTSDKVPPLNNFLQRDLRSKFWRNPVFSELLHNVEFMRGVILNTFPDAYTNFQLIYPDYTPVEVELDKTPDLIRTEIWGRELGNSKFKNSSHRTTPDIKEMIESFFNEGFSVQ